MSTSTLRKGSTCLWLVKMNYYRMIGNIHDIYSFTVCMRHIQHDYKKDSKNLKIYNSELNINRIFYHSSHKVAQLHRITLRSRRSQRTPWPWGGTAPIQTVEPESKVTSSRNVIPTDTPTLKSEPPYLPTSRYVHTSNIGPQEGNITTYLFRKQRLFFRFKGSSQKILQR